MALTDQQLLLLEQLEYFSDEFMKKAGVSLPMTGSVGDFLSQFTEEVLSEMDGKSDFTDYTTGGEWAAIIREIQSDPELCSLTLVNRSEVAHASCYIDPDGNAYVSFKGTTGGDEWYDNVQGLTEADTEAQKLALDYIESLNYDNITVVGHSKGGNKAQYVTILSDKVTRCVSMDGQGFSAEFLEKYAEEICLKGGYIKNFSLSTDYVHILMYPIPGSEQSYWANQGDEGIRNHAPGAYFGFVQDEDGSWHLAHVVGEDGNLEIRMIRTTENEGMTYLHEFTTFIIDLVPDDQKGKIAEYLGIALALNFGEDGYTIKGYKKEDLISFLLSDPESLGIVLAYVMKYVETAGLSEEQFVALLDALGLRELLEGVLLEIQDYAQNHPALAGLIGITAAALLDILLKNITDGKNDPIIEKLLKTIGSKMGIDLVGIWRNIEKAYTEIPDTSHWTPTSVVQTSGGMIYNYSQSVYSALVATISAVKQNTTESVSFWKQYSGEKWYSDLRISIAVKGINEYFDYLGQINDDCLKQIDRIFENVWEIDATKAEILRGIRQNVSGKAAMIRGGTLQVG